MLNNFHSSQWKIGYKNILLDFFVTVCVNNEKKMLSNWILLFK